MRSLPPLAFLALVAPVFFLPLACEDSSGSSSGGAFNPEAGPGFEAGTTEAGPLPEAGVDASPPAPLGVTVTVTEGGLPSSSVRVILQDAAGLVIGDKATDATGKVTVATAPSMVTVLIAHGTGAGSSVAPVTFVGVADGDKLFVRSVADVLVETAPVGQYSVSFTSSAANANANVFDVFAGAGCFNSGNSVGASVVVALYPGCLGPKNAVLTEASLTGSILGFGFAKDLAKPVASGTLDVGPLTFAAPGTTTLNATNVPATPFGSTVELSAVANDVLFRMREATGTVDSGGRSWKTPTGFAEAYQTEVSFGEVNASSVSTRLFLRREAVPASNILTGVDYASGLAKITDAALTKPTPARPEVALTSTSALTSADGGIATFHWSSPIAQSSGSWTVVFPPSTTTLKLPALPADATAFVPTDNVSIDEVIFLEATQLPGYKELKLLPIQPNFGVEIVDTQKPLPLPGTVRVTRWTPGVPG